MNLKKANKHLNIYIGTWVLLEIHILPVKAGWHKESDWQVDGLADDRGEIPVCQTAYADYKF